MSPKHRPTPPLPRALHFLTARWWMPIVAIWGLIFAITYLIWLLT
jgi:hypothetical protein